MATRARDVRRRLREKLLRAAARTGVVQSDSGDDAGLQQIADWGAWFLSAHTQRLAELNLPRDQHDRELADVTRIAAAVTDRMRSDYLARRRP